MGDIFPDTVLNVLCEEYSDFSKKNLEDGNELRMKLGEVLIKVTKILGEIAPKYKSLLLNTFLVGTKDEDHLIRASSLSNLGEICKVLGYKLGTIVTEARMGLKKHFNLQNYFFYRFLYVFMQLLPPIRQ